MKRNVMLSLFAAGMLVTIAAFSATPGRGQGSTPAIQEIQEFAYCCVPHKGPLSDMQTVILQLIQGMQTQNLFPSVRGPMVGVYYNSPVEAKPEDLIWEVGFIVTAQATPQAPLVKKVWSHTTVAGMMHVGPYEKAGNTIVRIMEWMSGQGYALSGPVLERYLDMNPAAVKPEELRTDIQIPCKKK